MKHEPRSTDVIDLDGYVRRRVTVTNASGGRGYESGLRTFNCPLCGESRQRGWIHVLGFVVGCFNAGCDANGQDDRLPGGAVEWVRRLEGLPTRSEAWHFLHRYYPRTVAVRRKPEAADVFEDFARLPELRFDWRGRSVIMAEAVRFMEQQWGFHAENAAAWDLGVCTKGRHAWRIVIPITMGGGGLVSFQTRTFRNAEPKYLFAKHGAYTDASAECGRPAAACLFNIDMLTEHGRGLLVEGAGDVMAWEQRKTADDYLPGIGLLGQALTPQKLAMLAAREPEMIYVGLDEGVAERRRALDHVADLQAWGIPAQIVRWVGGKDAGQGATIEVVPEATSLKGIVAAKVGR